MSSNANSADIMAIIGATGSGKTLYLRNYVLKKSDRRLWIWDYKREKEYAALVDLVTEDIELACMELRKAQFRVAFRPSFNDAKRARQFDTWCRAVWHAKNAVVVAEELGMVTTPQRAPAGWKQITTTGRSEGLKIIGLSQRPAQIDKDFFSNCTEIHCGFLNDENDVKTMARVLRLPTDDIYGLGPLEYFHKNVRTKEMHRGKTRVKL